MHDLFKKFIETGMEAQNRSIDFLDEMIKKGKIEKKDREKFLQELDDTMSGGKEKWEDFITEVIKKLEIKNPFASSKEITELQDKVKKLEEQVKKLEHKK